MPIPSKKSGEERKAFISRCMGDETMKKEYKDQDQRAAVCISKASEDLDMISQADFQKYFEDYGYEEEVTEDNFDSLIEEAELTFKSEDEKENKHKVKTNISDTTLTTRVLLVQKSL